MWLSVAEGGRFSQVVVPPGLDGNGLMSFNLSSLSALFAGNLKTARQNEEGNAWVEEVGEQNATLSTLLWSALRREQQSALARLQNIRHDEYFDSV